MIAEMIIALTIAFVLTTAFIFGLRRSGPWGHFSVFFLVIFLFSWGVGPLMAPAGPVIGGVYWIPFLIVGLLAALLLASLDTKKHTPGRRGSIEIEDAGSEDRSAFGLFFWIFVGTAAGLIILRLILF